MVQRAYGKLEYVVLCSDDIDKEHNIMVSDFPAICLEVSAYFSIIFVVKWRLRICFTITITIHEIYCFTSTYK